MDFSDITRRVNSAEIADLLVSITILLVFLWPALEYEGAMGQFPRVFLFIGLICLCVELVIHFLPDPYRETLQMFTSGLTEEMAENMETSTDAAAAADDVESNGIRNNDLVMLGLFLAVLAAFFAVSYLIGFLVAIPLFTLAALSLFGSWDILTWIVVTTLLMALTYGLFGEVMNVPIMNGEFL